VESRLSLIPAGANHQGLLCSQGSWLLLLTGPASKPPAAAATISCPCASPPPSVPLAIEDRDRPKASQGTAHIQHNRGEEAKGERLQG
jgi:hypothetical protein